MKTTNQIDKHQITRVANISPVSRDGMPGVGCLVIIYGKDLGRKFELYDEVVTIGREPENTISLNSDSVSRKHVQITYCKGDYLIEDLKSTNGTYLNDLQITKAKLNNGDLVKIGEIVLKFLFSSDIEALYHEEIYRMTIFDGLTQIYNKRYALEFLEREVSRAKRHLRPLSLLMMDIDHFKKVNDTYGHLAGDSVLKELAYAVSERIRKEELFARFGGEEFIIILPESDLQGAVRFGEIVKQLVEKHPFSFEEVVIPVTVSIGVANFDPLVHEIAAKLVEQADNNLYVAKNKGRNCVFG
jgi:diguanylate cyclase (GGDEF)-like protein